MSWSVRAAMAVALLLTLAAAVPRSAHAVVVYWNPHKVEAATEAPADEGCDHDPRELGLEEE